jgi:hypothetical protein
LVSSLDDSRVGGMSLSSNSISGLFGCVHEERSFPYHRKTRMLLDGEAAHALVRAVAQAQPEPLADIVGDRRK